MCIELGLIRRVYPTDKQTNKHSYSINIYTREEPVHRTPKGLVPTLKLALLGYPLSRRQVRPHWPEKIRFYIQNTTR